MKTDIVRRYAHKPILTKAQIPYPVETVHNAGVVKHQDEYLMFFRSHLRTVHHRFGTQPRRIQVPPIHGRGREKRLKGVQTLYQLQRLRNAPGHVWH